MRQSKRNFKQAWWSLSSALLIGVGVAVLVADGEWIGVAILAPFLAISLIGIERHSRTNAPS